MTMQALDRPGCVAVVGAGPHGLSALKALLQAGIPADGFDRAADLGGNWNFGGPTSRVYESTHLISSKPFTQFPDFPMPDAYPAYPSHGQVRAYFDAYARHFGLRERITFGAEVVRVEAVGTRWDVTVARDGRRATLRYDAVVVANGHNWSPKMPDYPGLADFAGEVIHSADYKSADQVRGRRVLVVGAGNTGCDIAVEAAQNARATFHSTRRGMSGQAVRPSRSGLTACHTSTNGWPTTSTCGPRWERATSAAMRLSLEPATRWSTRTPTRRPGPGENSRRCPARSSTPPRYSTTTPSSRRSSPHTFSTSSASWRPST